MKRQIITSLLCISMFAPQAYCLDNVIKKSSTTVFPQSATTSAPLTFDKPISFDMKPLNAKERHKAKNELARVMRNKMIKNMSAQDLKDGARLCLMLNNFDDALLFLDQLILTSNSVTEQKDAKLQRADIFFEKGLLKQAADAYNEFLKLYPGDIKVSYACYKGILSSYYCTLGEERDQTFTHTTINLCNNFIDQDAIQDYKQEIKTIRTQCYQRLFDHELSVFEFYFKRGRYKAAETRLANIKKTYESKLAATAPKVLHCQYRIAQAKGETKVAQELLASLHEQYPNFGSQLNKPNKKKVDYLTRF